MMNAKPFLPLIALGLAVAGCGTANRGVESVHQPVVSRTDYVLDLNAGYAGLDDGEAARLNGWFDSLKLGYGDKVAIDGGGSADTRDAVAAIAARYGLLIENNAPILPGAPGPGGIRIIVSRTSASVPGCPDWSSQGGMNFNNDAHSNYGCSVNSNLAAMMANPQDLVEGRTGDVVSDASTGGKAIKSYRDRKPTGDQPITAPSTRSQ